MKLKDYKQFILYTGASCVAMLVDLAIFTLSVYVIFIKLDDSLSILISSILARIISTLINFILSKKAFNSTVSKRSGIPKFFLLCAFQILLSSIIVILICKYIHTPKTITKCCVDFILYLIFYNIHAHLTFKEKKIPQV